MIAFLQCPNAGWFQSRDAEAFYIPTSSKIAIWKDSDNTVHCPSRGHTLDQYSPKLLWTVMGHWLNVLTLELDSQASNPDSATCVFGLVSWLSSNLVSPSVHGFDDNINICHISIIYIYTHIFLQTWWFKTTKIYSHNSGGRKPKPSHQAKTKVLAGHAPSRGSKVKSIPCPFQLLVAAGIPWLVASSLQFLPPWSHHLLLFCISKVPLPPFYKNTCDYIQGQ